MRKYSFDAVIFDLDGVVTKTALIHAQSWKEVFNDYLRLREKRDGEPFREFSHAEDYLPYVDGKPRYEGVKGFLESRRINIPFGMPSDLPDKETICGIGNKKNSIFLEILKKRGVEVYPSAVQFIRALKGANISTGVASSSKNCKLVLESAGIENLFETRVDGEVSVQLGLRGKPEGDIFVAAARNLGAIPAMSVVVEDAISGVQAGRNGGFGLVLGIARKNDGTELLENGADIVIHDFSEIDVEWFEKWFHRRPRGLFKFWNAVEKNAISSSPDSEKEGSIILNPCYSRSGKLSILNGKKLIFFLDCDGTLTPIVERPELAVISEDMKDVLIELSGKYTVAILSGRMRREVENLVGIKGLFYAGSHGVEISGPGFSMVQPEAEEAIPLISQIAGQLSKQVADIPGALVEEKKFSVALHYRLVDIKQLPRIKRAVGEIIEDNNKVRLMDGKKVFEILPDIDWDKGKAVRWIMAALRISWSQASVVYIGDDITDEYAFRVIRTRGTGILVSEESRESAANFRLSSTDEVKRLFGEVLSF